MRGEHFLLLAEREQLLPPAVLTQLRQILRAQKRPARGEAVARLLVERGFITVDQARRLVEAGSGPGSPLVASSNPLAGRPSPLAPSRPSQTPLSNSGELILEPVSRPPDPPPMDDQNRVQSDITGGVVTPPPVVTGAGLPTSESDTNGGKAPPSSPGSPSSKSSSSKIPSSKSPPPPPPDAWSSDPLPPLDEVSLSELSDSFSQWMDLPEDPYAAAESPSPLFAPRGMKLSPVLLYIGLATFALLMILFGLVILTKLRTG